jgi:hypothetical protein
MKSGLPGLLALALIVPAAGAPATATAPYAQRAAAGAIEKQRLIVLSDIEADPDDTESFVRLMLYSNEIDLEGLVATTSVHMKDQLHPESIRRVIDAYGKVRTNLLRHAPGYPTAESLLALVKTGQPAYGMATVGTGKDTPGSQAIIAALKADDPRPLWVTVWGGANTLAQALFTMRATLPQAELDRLIAKLRVYTISDQDDSGAWIRRTFPNLFYIVSPGGYGAATWTAINSAIKGADNHVIGNEWLRDHIQQGHGPLGAVYPDVAYGMEGDTPSWLGLIPNGLSDPGHPDWGGWGGRYELYTPALADMDVGGFTGGVPIEAETRPIWTNAVDTYTPRRASDYGRAVVPVDATFKDFLATLWRWREDFQNDFAARMGWTTLPYDQANHPPEVRLAHPDRLAVHSGERFVLSARGSSDPDGDSLSFLWFNYPEAGSWKQLIPPSGADNISFVPFVAPKVTRPETAHFIVKVTDKGSPPLTRYRRVIVTILP